MFNEWAAVIKHQDETEQSRIQQEKEELKQRQIRYKETLDS